MVESLQSVDKDQKFKNNFIFVFYTTRSIPSSKNLSFRFRYEHWISTRSGPCSITCHAVESSVKTAETKHIELRRSRETSFIVLLFLDKHQFTRVYGGFYVHLRHTQGFRNVFTSQCHAECVDVVNTRLRNVFVFIYYIQIGHRCTRYQFRRDMKSNLN